MTLPTCQLTEVRLTSRILAGPWFRMAAHTMGLAQHPMLAQPAKCMLGPNFRILGWISNNGGKEATAEQKAA